MQPSADIVYASSVHPTAGAAGGLETYGMIQMFYPMHSNKRQPAPINDVMIHEIAHEVRIR